MSNDVQVAVIVPTYNRRLKLIKTLASVVAQSKLPALVVVVDDGSSHGDSIAAERWLTRNASFHWKVIRQANAGVAAARNTGFAEIGDLPFVCFLDSDDLWPSEFLESGLSAFQGRDDIVATVADKVKVVGDSERYYDLSLFVQDPILWMIIRDGGMLSCSIFRSSAVCAAGLFVRGMRVSEDTDFLIRLFLLGGATRSSSSPVRKVKDTPLEVTEPRNLSQAYPDMPYLQTCYLEAVLPSLPPSFVERHSDIIRTAMAYNWNRAAYDCRKNSHWARALLSLGHAIKWDKDRMRCGRLVWSFAWGKSRILESFDLGQYGRKRKRT